MSNFDETEQVSVSNILNKKKTQKPSPPPPSQKPPPTRKDSTETYGSPDSILSFEEESKEILQGARVSSAKLENERARQAEKVRKTKERRLAKQKKREAEAQELLQMVNEADTAKDKEKERQVEKLRQRLEEKKNKLKK